MSDASTRQQVLPTHSLVVRAPNFRLPEMSLRRTGTRRPSVPWPVWCSGAPQVVLRPALPTYPPRRCARPTVRLHFPNGNRRRSSLYQPHDIGEQASLGRYAPARIHPPGQPVGERADGPLRVGV